MSQTDPNYLKALEASEISYSPAIGLVKEGTQITTSYLAKQNNTIIELLVSLHNRISRIESIIGKQKDSGNLQKTIEDLTSKVENLKIGSTSAQQVVYKEPQTLAVWIDPKEQIKAFREKQSKHGSS